jgi:hypothetical protein
MTGASGEDRSLSLLGFLVGLAALFFWGFGVFDFWAALTEWPPYAAAYSGAMLDWFQSFPGPRKLCWGASVACGFLGAGAMLMRKRAAGELLLAAVGLAALGFAYDLVFADGGRQYGADGLVAAGAVVAAGSFFAWAAYRERGNPG